MLISYWRVFEFIACWDLQLNAFILILEVAYSYAKNFSFNLLDAKN